MVNYIVEDEGDSYIFANFVQLTILNLTDISEISLEYNETKSNFYPLTFLVLDNFKRIIIVSKKNTNKVNL